MESSVFAGAVRARTFGVLLAACAAALTGCGIRSDVVDTPVGTPALGSLGKISGQAYGGQQPIVGSHIYVYAVGTTGYAGSTNNPSGAATSLLTLSNTVAADHDSNGYYVVTGSNGGFSISTSVTCTVGTQAYLYAAAGNPGFGNNNAAALLAPLGACSSSGAVSPPYSFININEVTTVVTAYALAGFATDATHISSSGTALASTGVANAMSNALNIVNIGTGTVSTTSGNGAAVVPYKKINTLANALASCVNSAGGTTSSDPCGQLFTDAGVPTSSDTVSAVVAIAHAPFANVSNLYAIGSPTTAPFQPTLASAPTNWTLGLQYQTAQYMNNQNGTATFVDNYSAAVDSGGNIWTRGTNDLAASSPNSVTTFVKYGPTGALLQTATSTGSSNSLSPFIHLGIDSSDTVWSGTAGGEITITSSGSLSTLSTGCSINGSLSSTVFGTGTGANITAYAGQYGSSKIFAFSPSSCTGTINAPANSTFDGYLANTTSGNVLGTGFTNSGGSYSNYVFQFTPGATGATASFTEGGDYITTDGSNSVWTFGSLSGTTQSDLLNKYTYPGGAGQGPSGGYEGGGLVQANYVNTRAGNEGVHIDGAGAVWVGITPCPNNCTGNAQPDIIAGLANDGTDAITPSTGLALPYNETGAHALALDGSGNLWVAVTDGSLLQFVGLTTPVATPILPGRIGVKP